jgi:glycosyltransferase involved in cell wall biosynthesis
MTPSEAELRVRYVTWGEYGSGVYESQVVRLVELLAERVVDVELWALVRRGGIERLAPPARGRLLPGPITSRWPWRIFGIDSTALGGELRGLAGPGVLHCRGPLATIAALRARRRSPGWRVVYDVRGAEAPELEEEFGPSRWTRRMAELERRASLGADLVSVVSKPLVELVTGFGVPDARVILNPTGVETQGVPWDDDARSAARRELGVGDGPLVVYVGSAAHWQLADVCVAAAARLADDVGATLIVLSHQGAEFRALAAAAGLPEGKLVTRALPHGELVRLVCAADVALLARRPSVVGSTAAPVKFPEYLAAGVPVVAVSGAGTFAELVEQERLGAVADEASPEAIAAAAQSVLETGADELARMRARCREAAERDYDLAGIADRYVESYRLLTAAEAG